LELALLENENQGWSLLRDYTDNSPHSIRTANLKKTLSRFADYGMFKTIAGKTVELVTLGGIRNLLFSSPLGQNKLHFSTAPR
jgi:hypothetical protein